MRKRLIAAAVAGTGLLLAFSQTPQETVPEAAQTATGTSIHPIAFPHDVHAGTLGMDCMYCHFSADRSVDAGIPPLQTCMGCHLVVAGTQRPEEVQLLRDYYNRGEPVPWVRIYKISDHARFPHMRHVAAGLTCQTCHGPVEEMGVIESRAREWQGQNMGWCISCHVRQDAARDCTVCHY